MEHSRPLFITNLSATDLEDIRFIGKMKVYAVVSVTGGPPTEEHISEFTTPVDMEGETNPKWDSRIDFTLHDPSLQNNLLYLDFNFHCSRTLGDKHVGSVRVPVKPLFDMISDKRTASETVKYPVEKSSGGDQGFVHFCFAFGAPIQQSPQQPTPPYTPQPQVVSKTQAQQVSTNSPDPYRSVSEQPVPNQANSFRGTAPANDQRNSGQQPPPSDTPQSQAGLDSLAVTVGVAVAEQVSSNILNPSESPSEKPISSEQPVPNQAENTSELSVPNQDGSTSEHQEESTSELPVSSELPVPNQAENTSELPVSSELPVPNQVGSTSEQPASSQANYQSGIAPANDQHNSGYGEEEDQCLDEFEDEEY